MPTGDPPPDDCGYRNCAYLNPAVPRLWCRACLIEMVEKLRGPNAGHQFQKGYGFPDSPSNFDY